MQHLALERRKIHLKEVDVEIEHDCKNLVMIKDYHGKVAELRDAVFGQSIRHSLPRGELPVLGLDKVAGIQHLRD